MRRFAAVLPPLLAVLVLAQLLACTRNPATGRRQLVLIGEGQELQMGRDNDKAVSAELGLYADDALQDYVQELGGAIAARSERPQLDWKFRVVDDPVVNAFALPGGYIYVTRGILAHFNNEAELASVLGHEIGHVTGRHSVNQMSKAGLAQVGLIGGMIIAPEYAEQFGQLAQAGLSLMFLKFSRDHERQADDLGLRYLLSGGYDPRPMPDVFETLARVSAASGAARLPGWMSTHPLPENRRERIQSQLAESGVNFTGRPVGREEYLRRLDGMMFGEDPQQGYFKDGVFKHPQMEFQLRVPDGWKGINQRQAVILVSPQQDAVVQLTMSSEPTASAAQQAFFTQEGVAPAAVRLRMASGLRTASSGFTAATQQGTVQGLAAFVEHGGRVFQLLGYTSREKWAAHGRSLELGVTSFDCLQDRRAVDARAKRLEVVRVDRGIGFDELARRHQATVGAAELALINGAEADARLEPGRSYKVVTGGYTP